jgi:PAS domain S-box-containing protein
MKPGMRKSGIEITGDIPWGTHFALFYRTKEDLIDILVPYFKAGLENGEYCLWVTAEPLGAGEAGAKMAAVMPDFDRYVENGQIEIIPYTDWYTIDGKFDGERVLNGWIDRLRQARERGFDGLRLTGNESWLDRETWNDFIDYEQTINKVIGQYNMLGLCSYPRDQCDANDILDVVSTHQFALNRRDGEWKIIEDQRQKRTRKALRESETSLAKSQEMAHIGSWELDVATGDVERSAESYRIFGLAPDEYMITYEKFLGFVMPEEREHVARGIQLAVETGNNYDATFNIRRKDGEIRVLHSMAEPIRDKAGRIVKLFGTNQDITERRRAEEERETTVRFLSLVNETRSTRDLIQTAAAFFQQRSGCEAVGIRLREGDNYPYYEARGFRQEFIRKENLLCSHDRDGRVLRDKDGFPMLDCMCGNVITGRTDPSQPFFTARGSFWTNSTTELLATTSEKDRLAKTRNVCNTEGYESFALIALRVGDERLGVLQLNDRRKGHFTREQIAMWERLADYLAVALAKFNAEEALIDAKTQAELYLDLMGHDINNMHQIALGYLELARDMIRMDEQQKEFLEKPIEVLQRATRLIVNVRKLQQLQEGLLLTSIVDVHTVLADVQREYGSVPGKTVTLNLNDHCQVRANEFLQDVFANLVGNAIKHTGDRAEVLITLEKMLKNGHCNCRVTVEDNGPGIPDNFKDLVFNRMLKGTEKAKGIGLGLYLVKSLVESYGGRVWVEDRVKGDPGRGAKFVVMLPAFMENHSE